MVAVEEFSRIVASIYDCAIHPECWPSTMVDIHTAFGATGAALVLADGVSRAPRSVSIPTEPLDGYRDYYRHIDFILEEVEAGPVGLVRGCEELIALQPNAEFHIDWMRPNALDDGLFVRLTDDAAPATFLLATEKRSVPFDTPERVRLAGSLVPHFQRALRLQHDLNDVTQQLRDISSAMDNVTRVGMAVVGPESSVLYLNSAAEAIVRRHDGLSIDRGHFDLADPAADTALRRGIVLALGQTSTPIPGGSSLLCQRPSGLRPYVLHVLPFRALAARTTDRRALILVVDPERQPEPSTELLRRLYGLTESEASVAVRLMSGDGVKPIADAMCLSVGTVKTHLQHIFDKTDTHRQAELVRVLLAVAL